MNTDPTPLTQTQIKYIQKYYKQVARNNKRIEFIRRVQHVEKEEDDLRTNYEDDARSFSGTSIDSETGRQYLIGDYTAVNNNLTRNFQRYLQTRGIELENPAYSEYDYAIINNEPYEPYNYVLK
jgi:hypothetical protein